MLKPFNEEELFARIDNLLINTRNRVVVSETTIPNEILNEETIIEEKSPLLIISAEDQEWLGHIEKLVQQHLSLLILTSVNWHY